MILPQQQQQQQQQLVSLFMSADCGLLACLLADWLAGWMLAGCWLLLQLSKIVDASPRLSPSAPCEEICCHEEFCLEFEAFTSHNIAVARALAPCCQICKRTVSGGSSTLAVQEQYHRW